jgi:hypothetical protein
MFAAVLNKAYHETKPLSFPQVFQIKFFTHFLFLLCVLWVPTTSCLFVCTRTICSNYVLPPPHPHPTPPPQHPLNESEKQSFNNLIAFLYSSTYLWIIGAGLSYNDKFCFSQIYVKVKLALEQAMKDLRGSRVITLPFLYFGARWWWAVNATPRPLYPRGRDSVPIVQEAEWVPAPVWMGAEKLASTGIQSPDSPPRSKLLYRLSYPGPLYM